VRRSFPIQRPGQAHFVQVVVKRSVLQAICEHGLSRTDVEVCGVLVGECCQDERGPFVYVEAMVRGEHSANQVAQVTFTSETWSHIHEEMDRHFPTKKILGWYHTHPGFGIFLSAMDLFIHENFFNASDQLALVYDPLSGDSGLFVWRHGKALVGPYLVEEDMSPEQLSEANPPRPPLTAGGKSDAPDQLDRIGRLERRQTSLFAALTGLAVLALVWPVVFTWLGLPGPFKPRRPEDSEIRLPEFPASRPPLGKRPARRSAQPPPIELPHVELHPQSQPADSAPPAETRSLPKPAEEPSAQPRPPVAFDPDADQPQPAPAPTKSNSPD
jgi:proteasome lid subunit RPN8/RPN11